MKILYSQIKELVPSLKASPKEVADALTLTGIMIDKFEPVEWNGKKDFLMGLEVRQNRPDCLGSIGVAREVAAYFGLKFQLPKISIKPGPRKLSVNVTAKDDVKRVLVVRIEEVQNGESPAWLKEFLAFHGMNSVSLLVDLSNYGMLLSGYPNHMFDADKIAGTLTWERSKKNQELITLDGTVLSLKKEDHLVISDSVGPLVLASAVGGKRSQVTMDTKNIVIELAVYDHAKLLHDARSLNVTTEAGNRLQKHLSPDAAWAMDVIIDAILKHAGGQVSSQIFSYTGKNPKPKTISLPGDMASTYAGINISEKKALAILERLGFAAKLKRGDLTATAPHHRTDIEDASDVVEEIIRVFGYDKIPTDEPSMLASVSDVTPYRIKVENLLKTQLASQGLDEVYSLPLTTTELNTQANYTDWQEVRTENSINEEFPVLRQSLASGLFEQQKTYLLKNVEHIGIFEAGKVFGKSGKRYEEKEMLAGLLQQGTKSLEQLKNALLQALLTSGVADIDFVKREGSLPPFANPFSCYTVMSGKIPLGIFYGFKPQKLTGNKNITGTALFELEADQVTKALEKNNSKAAFELTGKLVVLDANVEKGSDFDLASHLKSLKAKGGSKLWSLEVVDAYNAGEKTKYTVRASYKNVTDEQARKIHKQTFA